tara:strand:- start:65 stop:253 length:189 start_codon:yes stop_codon:yes gene_type:complete
MEVEEGGVVIAVILHMEEMEAVGTGVDPPPREYLLYLLAPVRVVLVGVEAVVQRALQVVLGL